jgi:hypothetical protein
VRWETPTLLGPLELISIEKACPKERIQIGSIEGKRAEVNIIPKRGKVKRVYRNLHNAELIFLFFPNIIPVMK